MTLLEIQSASGALWPDIQAAIITASADANKAASDAAVALASSNQERDDALTMLSAVRSERDSLIALRDEDHARSVGYVDEAKAHLQGLLAVLGEASMTTEELKAAKDAAEKAARKAELEKQLAQLT